MAGRGHIIIAEGLHDLVHFEVDYGMILISIRMIFDQYATSLFVTVFCDKPARTFRNEYNAYAYDPRTDNLKPKSQAPIEVGRAQMKIRAIDSWNGLVMSSRRDVMVG